MYCKCYIVTCICSYSSVPVDEEAELHEANNQSDDELSDGAEHGDDDGQLSKVVAPKQPLYVLPLYSLLASDRQAKVL